MYIFVLPWYKFGKAHGYDHFSFFFYVRLNLTVKSRHAIMASFKTLFLQNRYKLVAAGTEHRAVFKVFTNQLTGSADVFVPRLVPVGVVDMFQSVHVADQHGKLLYGPGPNQLVQPANLIHIRLLALYTGHGVPIGQLLNMAQLGLCFLRSPLHDSIIGEKHAQREHDQYQDNRIFAGPSDDIILLF